MIYTMFFKVNIFGVLHDLKISKHRFLFILATRARPLKSIKLTYISMNTCRFKSVVRTILKSALNKVF